MYRPAAQAGRKPGVAPMCLQCSDGRAARRSDRSVPLIERDRALELHSTLAGPAGPDQKRLPKAPRCSTQRAGIAPPHAEGDGLSGATFDGETFAFICGPAGVVGGVPLTRAMNPWAMPEAST